MTHPIIIIGGGAAGFFTAIHCKTNNPNIPVILIEKSAFFLAKVKLSGGGRCNVTHACFDPIKLSESYPRGGKALIGPFQQFQPRDTMDWFESRGVALKIESDNRVFPVSDSSESIVDCLVGEAERLGVQLWTRSSVSTIQKREPSGFEIVMESGQVHLASKLILATGSSTQGHAFSHALGHSIIPPVPSLFTVKINDPALTALSGLSVQNVTLKLMGHKTWSQTGPVLLTHWGFSGPALLKLSAWAARDFFEAHYQLPLTINWLPHLNKHEVESAFQSQKLNPKKMISNTSLFPEIPSRLWQYFVQKSKIPLTKTWQEFSKKDSELLADCLLKDTYKTTGKGQFKEEFVTCGGVCLSEVHFKTMESKLCPNLYFVGEILDIDGITGGFNFQNAWSTAYVAGTVSTSPI